jgi:EVE domain
MKKRDIKYWMLVASKNHVLRGIQEGIAQACHGKAQPLKRMQVGDGIIYYSSKLEFGKDFPCQEFTAIGFVCGEEIYVYNMGDGFIPFRRDIRYLKAKPVSIKPFIEKLNFIKNKKQWGYSFRFGAFEISAADFQLISEAMRINGRNKNGKNC